MTNDFRGGGGKKARIIKQIAFFIAQEEPRSFLSLDTEGRVIRLDSFSKVISSGIRVGFMTAAAPLIASVELHLQSSHLHAPTLSQVGRANLTLRGETRYPRCYSDSLPSIQHGDAFVSKFSRRGCETVLQIDYFELLVFISKFSSIRPSKCTLSIDLPT